uniref:Uncharacterized protein n=1 Tax=Trichogramma kaykai TaxID=54128 RepID=A0ABD2W2U0_9HYME
MFILKIFPNNVPLCPISQQIFGRVFVTTVHSQVQRCVTLFRNSANLVLGIDLYQLIFFVETFLYLLSYVRAQIVLRARKRERERETRSMSYRSIGQSRLFVFISPREAPKRERELERFAKLSVCVCVCVHKLPCTAYIYSDDRFSRVTWQNRAEGPTAALISPRCWCVWICFLLPAQQQLDAKSREWLVRAAQGDYQALAKLAAEEPRLARTKTRVTAIIDATRLNLPPLLRRCSCTLYMPIVSRACVMCRLPLQRYDIKKMTTSGSTTTRSDVDFVNSVIVIVADGQNEIHVIAALFIFDETFVTILFYFKNLCHA